MILFTSDLHFGHANIIRHCNRPFCDVEEMDETLIANWNAKVTKSDTVYILGDLIFRSKKPPEEYLSRLPGKKHLVVGNHDKAWMKKVELSKWFESVEMMKYFSDGQHKLTLCHYPMMTWPFANHDGWMVYGHIHENTSMDYWPLIERSERMLNAGVDINGFAPVSFEEMQQNNLKHRSRVAAQTIINANREVFDRLALLHKMYPELLDGIEDDGAGLDE